MNEIQTAQLDQAAFQRVWQRVMPEDRADCPFTVDGPTVPTMAPPQAMGTGAALAVPAMAPAPEEGTLYEREAEREETAVLEELLLLTAAGYRSCRLLARRWGRSGGRTPLAELVAVKRRQAKRLSAAYFLITGEEYAAPPTVAPETRSLALALRERFQAEQRAADQFRQAAHRAGDPYLTELYQNLAVECRECAGRLRRWFETA